LVLKEDSRKANSLNHNINCLPLKREIYDPQYHDDELNLISNATTDMSQDIAIRRKRRDIMKRNIIKLDQNLKAVFNYSSVKKISNQIILKVIPSKIMNDLIYD